MRPNSAHSTQLTQLQRDIIDHYQHGFPLTPMPFQTVAQHLGTTETEVIDALDQLQSRGMISRIGPVFCHSRSGASTLAALAVPEGDIEAIAAQVSRFSAVNHNYTREHQYNLWFVIAAPKQCDIESTLTAIQNITGLAPLNLPMEQAFHIDLGFPVQWN